MERHTPQKQAIRQVFEEEERPLTAQEVWGLARERLPGLGQATSYRVVKDLVERSWLKVVDFPGESVRYERADQPHHHFFQCRRCGEITSLQGCFQGIQQLVPQDFEVESHELIFYGRCPDCLC